MITSRRTLILGIFIVLIPFLGFPSAWKTFMTLVAGATLVSFSVNITIPKKIPKRIARRKETVNSVFRESIITTPNPSKKEKTIDKGHTPFVSTSHFGSKRDDSLTSLEASRNKNWEAPLSTPDKGSEDEL